MSGYTKLFGSILDSTIWLEALHIKVTWITLLAMADKNGVIESSIPGLAKRAGVTVDQCEEALEKFKSPDPYSKNPDFEGRRIDDTPGGWQLLNHSYYRKLEQAESERERKRIWWAENKSKKVVKSANTSEILANTSDDSRTLAKTSFPDPDPDPESDPKKDNKDKKAKYSKEFLSFWDAYPRKVGKRAANKAWQRAIKLVSNDCAINEAVEAQKKSAAWLKDNGQYIPYPATWLNQGRWEDETEPDLAKPIEVDKEYEEAMATFKFK